MNKTNSKQKKSKQQISKQQSNLLGIFTLHGIKNQNQVKIEHIQNAELKNNEHIPDTLVKKINIFRGTDAEIYSCNITNSFLMSSKKLPMMYVNVIHEKPLRRILLFRVYLYFTITINVQSSTQLLNNNLDGTFSLEISLEGTKKQLDNQIDKYPGDDEMYKTLTTFVLAPEMQELCKGLIYEIDKKLVEEYEKEFEYYKPPTNVISLKNYDFSQ